MKRFSIMVMEYGSDREIELCQVQSNPEASVAALKKKKLRVRKTDDSTRRSSIGKYTSIRVVDHGLAP